MNREVALRDRSKGAEVWYWDAPGGSGWVWMGVMMAVVWLPLLVALLWALHAFAAPRPRSAPPAGGPRGEGPGPRDLARLAYARGEFDRKRYLEILDDLDRSELPARKR